MKRRRLAWAIAAAVLCAAVTVVVVWRSAAAQREVLATDIPARPNLGALPAEFLQRLVSAEQRAQSGPDRVLALGELSRLYHANGFCAEASQCYQGLLRADPDNPRWPHLLATILAGYGRLEDAMPLWRRAVKLAPDYLPARLRLGDVLLKTNQNAEAAETYAAVLDREPGNSYALLGLARIDIDMQRWAAARDRLELVVEQTNYGIGYDLLPTVYERLGDADRAEAIRAKGKASGAFYDMPDPWNDELFDDCYDTYRLMVAGGTADHSGDVRTAIRILDRADRLTPNNVPVQFQLGELHLKSHDTLKARRYFERCVVLKPDFADGWAQLIDLLMKQGDRAASDRALAAALANCPNSPWLHMERGRRLNTDGRLTEAIKELQESIRLRPNEGVAYVDLARVYFQLNRVDDGVAQLRKSLQVEPENPYALSTLTFRSIKAGDKAGAREWMSHVRLQPRISPEMRSVLLKAFQQQFGEAP